MNIQVIDERQVPVDSWLYQKMQGWCIFRLLFYCFLLFLNCFMLFGIVFVLKMMALIGSSIRRRR